jgi:hypothetical protein
VWGGNALLIPDVTAAAARKAAPTRTNFAGAHLRESEIEAAAIASELARRAMMAASASRCSTLRSAVEGESGLVRQFCTTASATVPAPSSANPVRIAFTSHFMAGDCDIGESLRRSGRKLQSTPAIEPVHTFRNATTGSCSTILYIRDGATDDSSTGSTEVHRFLGGSEIRHE